MQVKNISWVSFAAWRSTQQEADLPVRPGLLGQVIVNNQARLRRGRGNTRPLHTRSTERCTAWLQTRLPMRKRRWCASIASCSSKLADHNGYRGCFLADSDINTLDTPVPFWLMMVSIATAVLPVWRSPMISSRWPRPIGTIESMDLRPVCIGCRH